MTYKATQVYDTIHPLTFHPVRLSRNFEFSQENLSLPSSGRINEALALTDAITEYLRTRTPKYESEFSRMASFTDSGGTKNFLGPALFDPASLDSDKPIDCRVLRTRKHAWTQFCESRSSVGPDTPAFTLAQAQAMLRKLKHILEQATVQVFWKTVPHGFARAIITSAQGKHLMLVDSSSILNYEYNHSHQTLAPPNQDHLN